MVLEDVEEDGYQLLVGHRWIGCAECSEGGRTIICCCVKPPESCCCLLCVTLVT